MKAHAEGVSSVTDKILIDRTALEQPEPKG